jgi:NAD-dependent deacetylase
MKEKIVVFSGAGMSAESGIQTFRDSNGLWEKYRIEDVATPDAWKRNPKLVQDFYNQRRKQILESAPNEAHLLIKSLESRYEVTVITQNIDDLHERAGSTSIIHLHGNITQSKSSGPNKERAYYDIDGWELKLTDLCPEGYPLRPHVVWFGEEVPMYDKAIELIQQADILIVIGTSLQVYPAAGIIHYAPNKCKKFIIDPAVKNLSLPANFHGIEASATEGLQKVIEILILD